jgi:hypothetical protein
MSDESEIKLSNKNGSVTLFFDGKNAEIVIGSYPWINVLGKRSSYNSWEDSP